MKARLSLSTFIIIMALLCLHSLYDTPSAYSSPNLAITPTPTVTTIPKDKQNSSQITPSATKEAPYQEIADEFFATLAEDGGESAIQYAFSNNPYADRLDDQLAILINQFTSAERLMGEYQGYELLAETTVADRLVVQYYLVMYDRNPLKFELAFYRPADEWHFQNFLFNSSIIEDISTLTKLSLLQSDKVNIWPEKQTVPTFTIAPYPH